MTMKQESNLDPTEELQEIAVAVVDVDSSGHVEARDAPHVQTIVPPLPLFTDRTGEGAPRTPDRREGHTPRYANGIAGATYFGSPGFGSGNN